MKILAVIPARYASTRLPGKPLVPLAGKPMIARVWERVGRAASVSGVVVATDDERIRSAVEAFGGQAILTRSEHRSGTVFEYPTVAEKGYPGYEFGNWYGILVPVKTPKETIAAIHAAAVSALKSPSVSKRMTDLGYIIVGDRPEEFAAHIKLQIATLAKIIQQTGVTVN